MADNAVQMVLTDIPYGEVNARDGGVGAMRRLDKAEADALDFDPLELVDESVRVCSGSFYVFCGYEQASSIVTRFRGRHGLTARVCMWRKTDPSPLACDALWLSDVELCVFARKPYATFHERYASSVWDCPIARKQNQRHPTEKPLALFERLVLASSNPGDTILDPCAGSGTTGEAAFTHDRHSILIERHPKHVATIRERMAGLNTDLFHAA